MPGSAHQQQMPQSMSTGNNTIGGHGGHDRGGGGAGGGGGGGGGMPVAGPGGPHCQMSGSQPLVMPAFPLRNSHSAHTPHYSPYSPSRYAHISTNTYVLFSQFFFSLQFLSFFSIPTARRCVYTKFIILVMQLRTTYQGLCKLYTFLIELIDKF